jgi:hypothetical protein
LLTNLGYAEWADGRNKKIKTIKKRCTTKKECKRISSKAKRKAKRERRNLGNAQRSMNLMLLRLFILPESILLINPLSKRNYLIALIESKNYEFL